MGHIDFGGVEQSSEMKILFLYKYPWFKKGKKKPQTENEM